MQGITAARGEEDGVHVQGRRRAQDRAHIGGVGDAVQNSHPAGASGHFCQGFRPGAAHGAQTAPGQRVASQLRQGLPVGGIDGDLGAAVQQGAGDAFDLPPLHQEGHRLAAGIQGMADDLVALGDEEPLVGISPASQLGFREPEIGGQGGMVQIGDLNDVGHGVFSLVPFG